MGLGVREDYCFFFCLLTLRVEVLKNRIDGEGHCLFYLLLIERWGGGVIGTSILSGFVPSEEI